MTHRRRHDDDRGATLIEAAIVMPLLFLLLFGIIEIGSALKSYSTAANATRAGTRTGSVAGNDADADLRILQQMAKESTGFGSDEIDYIIVWNATDPSETVGHDSGPPMQCVRAAGPATSPNTTSLGSGGRGPASLGACNVYVRPAAPGGAFAMANGEVGGRPGTYWFGCGGRTDPQASHKLDCNWVPTDRKVAVSARGTTDPARPDFIGIHISALHQNITGVLGPDLTITDDGITLIEPDAPEAGP